VHFTADLRVAYSWHNFFGLFKRITQNGLLDVIIEVTEVVGTV
jgi:hypothetical protein